VQTLAELVFQALFEGIAESIYRRFGSLGCALTVLAVVGLAFLAWWIVWR